MIPGHYGSKGRIYELDGSVRDMTLDELLKELGPDHLISKQIEGLRTMAVNRWRDLVKLEDSSREKQHDMQDRIDELEKNQTNQRWRELLNREAAFAQKEYDFLARLAIAEMQRDTYSRRLDSIHSLSL